MGQESKIQEQAVPGALSGLDGAGAASYGEPEAMSPGEALDYWLRQEDTEHALVVVGTGMGAKAIYTLSKVSPLSDAAVANIDLLREQVLDNIRRASENVTVH